MPWPISLSSVVRRLSIALLACLVTSLVVAGVAVPSSAAVAGTGSVSGTVTGPGGAPLQPIIVNAYRDGGGFATAEAEPDGHYSIDLEPGTWRLTFRGWLVDGSPASGEVDDVLVEEGSDQSGIDVTLALMSHVAGQMTDAEGNGVPGRAELYILDDSGDPVGTQIVSTEEDGTFDIVVEPGSFKVGFTAVGYATTYHSGKTRLVDADAFSVASGDTVSLAPVMVRLTSWVDGVVRTSAGEGLAGVMVTALDATRSPVGNAFTDATGEYRLYAPAGSYDVSFVKADYIPGELADVAVVEGGAPAPDATLYRGATVSGVVVDAVGDPVVGAEVWLCGVVSLACATPETDSQGQWSTNVLGVGDYTVQYVAAGYQSQYHSGHLAPSLVDVVHLTDGQNLSLGTTVLAELPPDAPTIEAVSPPAIAGSARVGQTLTAVDGTCSSEPDEIEYRWFVDGTSDADAHGRTFLLGEAEHGKTIRVELRCYASGHVSGSGLLSTATAPVADAEPQAFTFSIAPAINGAAEVRVGDTLAVDPGAWSPAATGFTYLWSVGGVPVDGANDATYSVRPDDVGKRVTVEVMPVRYGFTATPAPAAPTASVQLGRISNPASLALSAATAVVDEPVTVTGSWLPGDAEVHYEWHAGDDKVGADAATFTPTLDMLGSALTVTVTANRAGYEPFAKTLSVGAVSGGPIVSTRPSAIDGPAHPKLGDTLEVDLGDWSPSPTSYDVVWTADGEEITAADDSTELTLSLAEVGAKITVEVTAELAHHSSTTVASAATEAVGPGDITEQTAPSLSSLTPKVDDKLTVQPGDWLPDGVSLSYAWTSGTTPVGENSPTYTVTPGDVGKTITVTITVAKAGHTTVVRALTTEAVAPATVVKPPAPTQIRLAVPPRLAKVRRGKPIKIFVTPPAGASASYDWVLTPRKAGPRKPKPRTVGHGSSIRPKRSWKGGRLRVTVTVTKRGYLPTTYTVAVPGKLR